jgi:hypothetical protein
MLSRSEPVSKLFHQAIAGPLFFVDFIGQIRGLFGHVFKGSLRLSHDADVEAILDKNVVNAPPARTICPSSVRQHRAATSFGLEAYTEWLAPSISTLWRT